MTSISKPAQNVNTYGKMGQKEEFCIVEIGYAVEKITDSLGFDERNAF